MSRSSTPGASRSAQPGVKPSSQPIQRDGATALDGRTATGWTGSNLPASADALATGLFQDVLGNGLLLDSLAGNDVQQFGSVVAAELGMASAGMETGGFTSNTAMARVLRDAIGNEAAQALAGLSLGAGTSIPARHKERMERAFGHEFDHVRIHTGSQAQRAAQSINAYAFAIGSDIFFGRGTWAPGSTQGDRLLAHELTHVVQHDQGRIPTLGSDQDAVSSPSDPLEREAYGNEVHILSVLQQVDAELRAEASGALDVPSAETEAVGNSGELDTQVETTGLDSQDLAPTVQAEPDTTLDRAPQTVTDTASVESVVSVATPESTTDGFESMGDAFGLEVAGGFAAATPPASPADESGSAMRDARGPAPEQTEDAQQQIRRSRGRPLPADVATRMSAVLGHDLSHVQVHDDAAAHAAAAELSANAFALGADLYFSEGAFRPGTADGDRLLAHELTHVVQHDEGRLPETGGELQVSSPTDSLEAEARTTADQAVQTPAVDTSALDGWGEPSAPQVVAERVSLALGFANGPVGALGAGELDHLASSLGADAFGVQEHTATGVYGSAQDTGLALREAEPQADASGTGVPIPEELAFVVAGRELILDLKAYVDKVPGEVEVPINQEPVAGLKLTVATLEFEDGAALKQGSIHAELKIGDFEAEGGLELALDDEFNVSAEARDLTLRIGDAFTAVANVTIDNMELTASVNATFDKPMDLGSGVTMQSATLSGAYEANHLHLEGDVLMRFGEWVEGTIHASYDVDTVEGEVASDADLDQTLEAGEDAGGGESTQEAPAGGGAGQEEAELAPETQSAPEEEGAEGAGSEEESEEELATEPAPVTLAPPTAGRWNATGTLSQIKDLTKGDVTLTGTELTVNVEDNVLATVGAKATVLAPHLEGKIEGQLDVPGEALYGTGTIDLTEPLRLDELGVTLESLHAQATVESNRLIDIKGNLNAKVDYEEQPTFDVTGEELSYDFEEETFGGTGTVTTMRAITFGETTRVIIAEGASATATVEEGRLKSAEGGLDFTVEDDVGAFAAGKVELNLNEETQEYDARGNLLLTSDYGVPDREQGPLLLKEGGELTAVVEGGEPKNAELDNVQFELTRPEPDLSGKVGGSVEGTYDFDGGTVTGEGHASVLERWSYELPWGGFHFDEGGQVDVSMTESAYDEIKMYVPFTAEVTKGLPFTIAGEVDGNVDGETFAYSGEIVGNLEEDLAIAVPESADTLTVLQETSVGATLTDNNLDQLDFDMRVHYHDKESELTLDGSIEDGVYKLGDEEGSLSFHGELNLMREIARSTKGGELQAKVLAGAGVEVDVVDNKVTRLGGQLKFQVHDKEGLLLDGDIKDAEIDAANDWAFSGDLDVKTGRDLTWPRKGEGEGEGLSLKVLQGSGVTGRVEDSDLAEVTADLDFEVEEGSEGKLAEGTLSGKWQVEEDNFEGDGELKLVRDYALSESDPGEGRLEGWSIVMVKDSALSASMKENKLASAKIDVETRFLKNEEAVAKGQLSGEYALADEAGYSGDASVELIEEVEWAEDSRFTYTLAPPTKVDATAEASNLKSASGTFVVHAKEDDTDKVEITADATYTPGSGITATGTVKVLEDILIADKEEWKVFLAQDSGGDAKVTEDVLEEIGGTIKLRLDKGDVPMVGGEFSARYKLSDGESAEVTASGEVTVLNDIEGAFGEDDGYAFVVEKDTSAGAEVKDGELEKIDGVLKARVEDESEFLHIDAEGSYERNGGDPQVSAEGKVTVTRDKTVVDDDIKVVLVKDSAAEAKVEANELQSVGANVKVRVDATVQETFGPVVEGELDGAWTKGEGTTGWAKGKLLREIPMGEIGEYKFFIEKDASGEVHVVADVLTEVGGDIGVRIDDDTGPFIKGKLNGTYVFEGDAGFTGGGKAEVVREKQLGELNGETLWVEPATGAEIQVTNNNITSLSGNVKLSLRDGEGEYVDMAFSGEYDTSKKSFKGKGDASVTRDKKLFEATGYSFWLKAAEGAGVNAEVDDNKLTKVGGDVPFMVKDDEVAPLIEGRATGDYDPKTGMFSGTGGVFLGRDVEYELGAGKLVFKKGSGGTGTVTDSKLEKLGGKLEVDIHDGEGLLLTVEAEGEFDAVQKKILWVEGSATLARPMEPLGKDILVIDSLTGKARVENNELKWAEGEGSFTVKALNDMKGNIKARYENRGGEEIYTGKGSINFTLFEDASKGRKMDGLIEAELKEGGKFDVHGKAHYTMSDLIEGDVDVVMDEKMDPVINASMKVQKELIKGQDLFNLDMPLIPHTSVPIYGPISMGFGASAGMGLKTRPLTFEATIGVIDWKPISADSKVPDFEAELALNWGLDFHAMLAAYLTLELNAGIGSAGAGVRGEVLLDAPLSVRPYGKLRGGKSGFYGELGVGVKLEPTLKLKAIPFVYAQLKGFDMLKHDFPGLEKDLGSIFSFEWGTKYTFGDESKREEGETAAASAPAGAASEVEHSEPPAVAPEKIGSPQANPGGPQLESGSDIAGSSGSDRASEGGSEMDEFKKKMDQVTILADGLGAISYLLDIIVSLITALMVAGPVGLVIVLAWKIFKGDITWDKLVDAVNKVVEAVTLAAELLRPHLPDWLNGVIDFFSGESPSLLDAFFGADDKIRAEVYKGTYKDFPADSEGSQMMAEWIDEMCAGYCGSEDEGCIMTLLYHAESTGQLSNVVHRVDGGPDHMDYKIDKPWSPKFRALMDRNGIKYKKSFW